MSFLLNFNSCCALKESLRKSQLDGQLDLKELWRLVQKDVENECMSDGQVRPPLRK